MKFSLAILTALAAACAADTITHYHTVYHTVVHTHTVKSTHIVTLNGADGQPTTSTSVSTSTGTEAPLLETTSTSSTSTLAAATTTAQETTEATTTAEPTTTSSTSSTSSTSTTSTSASSSPTSDFASSILAEHNKKRALNGVANLTWSTELEEYAQNYADNYDCDSGTLTHSGGPYGENLALGYDTIPAVDAWYDEIKDYDFSNPGFSESTGHFTQLVWKSSTELGCGYKYCGSYYGQYTICSYNPAGNVIGEFAENVLPLVSSS